MAKIKTSVKKVTKTVITKKVEISHEFDSLPNAPKSFVDKDVSKIYAYFKNKRVAMQMYQGRLCFFFKMGGKFKNEILEDGFIAAGNDKKLSVPPNIKMPFIASIFVKFPKATEYKYLGDVNNVVNEKGFNKYLWG